MSNPFNFTSRLGKRSPDMSIEWEFQPSMQHLVVRSDDVHHDESDWAETTPASLDTAGPPSVFHEPLEGLSMRDIDEPEVFNVLFAAPERTA